MGKPEGIVENYLKTQAKKHVFLCQKFVAPGTTGVPDRILIGHGLTIFVECKAPNGVLRKRQKIVIKEMQEHGAFVCVLHTKTIIDDFFHTLESHAYKISADDLKSYCYTML